MSRRPDVQQYGAWHCGTCDVGAGREPVWEGVPTLCWNCQRPVQLLSCTADNVNDLMEIVPILRLPIYTGPSGHTDLMISEGEVMPPAFYDESHLLGRWTGTDQDTERHRLYLERNGYTQCIHPPGQMLGAVPGVCREADPAWRL